MLEQIISALISYCRSGIYQSNGCRWRRGHHSWKRAFRFRWIAAIYSAQVFVELMPSRRKAGRLRVDQSWSQTLLAYQGSSVATSSQPFEVHYTRIACRDLQDFFWIPSVSNEKATSLAVSLALSGPDYKSPWS